MATNYLTTPVGDKNVDSLRNIARRAAARVYTAERKAAAAGYSNLALDSLIEVENKADAAFDAFRKAHIALIG